MAKAGKKPLNIALDADARELLMRVTAERRMAGGYLSRLVRERWREWTRALVALRAAGWERGSLLAACDALSAHWLTEGLDDRAPQVRLVQELRDAQRLRNVCDKWDVDPLAWARLVAQLRKTPALASDLALLVREYWSDNAVVQTAIRDT